MDHMNYATASIDQAQREDARGNIQMRNHLVSRLRADSELPSNQLERMLMDAGLSRIAIRPDADGIVVVHVG